MKLNPYLNFPGTCEEAFNFYKTAFGVEFTMMSRFGDVPSDAGYDPSTLPPEEQQKIMHVSLPIGDNILMGSDVPMHLADKFSFGTSAYVSLHPDTLEEAERLFAALSEGGEVELSLTKMFWGAYYGSFKDKFGISWMINYQFDGQE